MYDIDSNFYELQGSKELYLILTGKSYREIAINYYQYQKYKFIYKIRKIMKKYDLKNRRQLAFFAVKNKLVTLDKIYEYL